MLDSILLLAAANPVDHVIDKPITADWMISNATVMLVVSAVVTAALMIPAAKRITTGSRGSIDDLRAQGILANLVETVCVYLRDEVFRPVLEDQTDRFCPMLWTFFWFILSCNLLGLVPFLDLTAMAGMNHGHGIGGTATQSIWVTGALASIAFLFYNGVALVKDPVGFLKHMTGGAPWFMWPIMVPVEVMGLFVKPFALALRLFANMTGGHIILAVLLGFVASLIQSLGGVGYGLALIPLLGCAVVNLLEVLVAFIQAFIFTFLTCLFLGQLVIHEHEEHDESDHDEPAAAH